MYRLLQIGPMFAAAVISTSTVMPRNAFAGPVKLPLSGMAWLGSRVTATRIRLRPPTSALVGSNSTQPAAWQIDLRPGMRRAAADQRSPRPPGPRRTGSRRRSARRSRGCARPPSGTARNPDRCRCRSPASRAGPACPSRRAGCSRTRRGPPATIASRIAIVSPSALPCDEAACPGIDLVLGIGIVPLDRAADIGNLQRVVAERVAARVLLRASPPPPAAENARRGTTRRPAARCRAR